MIQTSFAFDRCGKQLELNEFADWNSNLHFVRECVEDGRIKLLYIPTNEQAADILTKNLAVVKIRELRSEIGVQIYQRGGVSK